MMMKGYIMVKYPSHPNANKQGYIFEHRLVMSRHLNRPLRKDEYIHHVNGNKQDNRISNLIIVSASDHNKLHPNKPQPIQPKNVCHCKRDNTVPYIPPNPYHIIQVYNGRRYT